MKSTFFAKNQSKSVSKTTFRITLIKVKMNQAKLARILQIIAGVILVASTISALFTGELPDKIIWPAFCLAIFSEMLKRRSS